MVAEVEIDSKIYRELEKLAKRSCIFGRPRR
jgi:hypothetical protein